MRTPLQSAVESYFHANHDGDPLMIEMSLRSIDHAEFCERLREAEARAQQIHDRIQDDRKGRL